MRVQVDDDASPGVLCVSVRVAVFGGGAWGVASAEWGRMHRVLSRNTTLVTLDRYRTVSV